MKKILFAASECVPFVKTGGLADVVGALPKSYDKKEYDVRVIIPFYHAIDEKIRAKADLIYYFQMDNRIYVGIKKLVLDGITYYFIDNEKYFSGLVPYYDLYQDLERFAYFSKAVLSSLPLINFRPDIIHCHDWQTALIPVYLNTVFQGDPFFRGMKTIMTIHNIRFQGSWNVGHLRWVSSLPDSVFQPGLLVSPFQNREIPHDEWNASFMRGGLVYSDWITTVSPSYAKEIQTPAFGDGLDDILRWRKDRLKGIINGIDYQIWDPSHDTKIEKNYKPENVENGKKANKTALQKELGLKPDENVFTISIISRLTDQKGLDLVDQDMDELCSMPVNIIVLGTGDERYENMFRYYQGKYPDKVSANIMYSDQLSHKIYAASDALLIPSAFEPCGLTQLISLKYGTVPIVHEVGGLKDSITPYNPVSETGNGFSFYDYTPYALMDRIRHAFWLYSENRKYWLEMQKRGMKEDWSWKKSSKIYEKLYDELYLLGHPGE